MFIKMAEKFDNKEDFVTYEQAVKLKELGFDWGCNHYYGLDGFLHEETQSYITNYIHSNKNTYPIPAPTLSQAQKWLREVKGIDVIVLKYDDDYDYKVYSKDMVSVTEELFETYEKALSTGVNEAFEILKH